MSLVQIHIDQGKLFVKSPYNTRFVQFARDLNGRWSGTEWGFDPRDDQKVRDKCVELYGTDGERQAPLVTLRVGLGSWDGPEITLGGRPLATRLGRDRAVKLGDGVVILKGGFAGSGGSVKNPRVDPKDGTVLEVRDFPEALAQTLVPDAGRANAGFTVEIVEQAVFEAPQGEAIRQAFNRWLADQGWTQEQVMAAIQPSEG